MSQTNTVAYKIIKTDEAIEVPPDVAVCPYCDTKLTASFTGWSEADDGSGWIADEVTLDCETEPDMDSDEWEDWWASHSDMPYVYLLPVCEKVKTWVNAHYRFDDDDFKQAL